MIDVDLEEEMEEGEEQDEMVAPMKDNIQMIAIEVTVMVPC